MSSSGFEVITVIVTPFQQNCRILACRDTSAAVVIDPGGDVDLVMQAAERRSLSIEQIWLTHSHIDHCGGVADLKERTDAVLYGHKEEELMRTTVLQICDMYGLPKEGMKNCPEPDHYIDESNTLEFSDFRFEIFFTPGHSPGHLCFYHVESANLLAGDTLFAGSIGRTDLPGGDYYTLMDSIKQKIMTLPDETAVLCGHGPETSVGVERSGNPFIAGL